MMCSTLCSPFITSSLRYGSATSVTIDRGYPCGTLKCHHIPVQSRVGLRPRTLILLPWLLDMIRSRRTNVPTNIAMLGHHNIEIKPLYQSRSYNQESVSFTDMWLEFERTNLYLISDL